MKMPKVYCVALSLDGRYLAYGGKCFERLTSVMLAYLSEGDNMLQLYDLVEQTSVGLEEPTVPYDDDIIAKIDWFAYEGQPAFCYGTGRGHLVVCVFDHSKNKVS